MEQYWSVVACVSIQAFDLRTPYAIGCNRFTGTYTITTICRDIQCIVNTIQQGCECRIAYRRCSYIHRVLLLLIQLKRAWTRRSSDLLVYIDWILCFFWALLLLGSYLSWLACAAWYLGWHMCIMVEICRMRCLLLYSLYIQRISICWILGSHRGKPDFWLQNEI